MDPVTIATLVLSGAAKAAELAAQAIQAYREGDDAKALELLDQALAQHEAGTPAARAALDEVKAKSEQAILAKFGPLDGSGPESDPSAGQ